MIIWSAGHNRYGDEVLEAFATQDEAAGWIVGELRSHAELDEDEDDAVAVEYEKAADALETREAAEADGFHQVVKGRVYWVESADLADDEVRRILAWDQPQGAIDMGSRGASPT